MRAGWRRAIRLTALATYAMGWIVLATMPHLSPVAFVAAGVGAVVALGVFWASVR